MAPAEELVVHGAREHNLKNVTVRIPRSALVCVTGLSGSGKSSLAFDTIYAEGQRRYVESLSAYARQFLQMMEKPDVDSIDGLSPAISIDQKTTSRNPRSTVGTVTEIYDYLRLLYARIGRPHCPVCGRPITGQSLDQIVEQVLRLPEGTKFTVNAPVARDRKGEFKDVLEELRRDGFTRVKVDGEQRLLEEAIELDKKYKHTIEVVVDRLAMKPELRQRLTQSVETATSLAEGLVVVDVIDGEALTFSENLACPEHGVSLPELEPRVFSFNSPHGACPRCTGLGAQLEIDPDLLVPDSSLSINEGALVPWTIGSQSFYDSVIESIAERYEISLDTPWRELEQEQQDKFLYGTDGDKIFVTYRNRMGRRRQYTMAFEGLVNNLQRRYRETDSSQQRDRIEEYMSFRPCPDCGGARLKPAILAVTIGERSIHAFTQMSVTRALAFLDELALTKTEELIGQRIVKEIRERLTFLDNVGVGYLQLDRAAKTLSGGEAQRLRLATQIGSQLVGVLYILDEPSIGLHQRDNGKLIATLERLRDLGNTVLVVEHDEQMMRAADWIVDLGPGAGEHGGEIVGEGTAETIAATEGSITGRFLSGERRIAVPFRREEDGRGWFSIRGASMHNLKGIDVDFPVGRFVAVTGVSGSGKSTLVNEILYKALANRLNRMRMKPGEHESVEGIEVFDKVIDIDQTPIGRTPRSNPATYTDLFTHVRELYSLTPEAKVRGYKPGRFSFNVKGGRCETCKGDGTIKIEMHFLPDVYVPCETCHGRRYNRETLEVRFKGKSIADILEMSVEEALDFFAKIPKIRRRLQTLHDVGLDYVKLGQPATTLSGGEAQRVKLAAELSKVATGKTLYILDEPTTGLHFADIEKLLEVLQRLVDNGNTVLVIEHNLDVIKQADWIVDLGPEGGEAGGEVLAVGTPEEIAEVEESSTGQFLRGVLAEPAAAAAA
ncbi:MAG: excinuclease ABC subunit UvrA [Actinomycetota bacterium]|nr:excinuclease ABC subunit UvrA [Actinomycetota bacterium]